MCCVRSFGAVAGVKSAMRCLNEGKTGMKVTENCINHNVCRMVKELTESIWEGFPNDEDAAKWAYMTLANIRGIVEMAEVLKEVLKA